VWVSIPTHARFASKGQHCCAAGVTWHNGLDGAGLPEVVDTAICWCRWSYSSRVVADCPAAPAGRARAGQARCRRTGAPSVLTGRVDTLCCACGSALEAAGTTGSTWDGRHRWNEEGREPDATMAAAARRSAPSGAPAVAAARGNGTDAELEWSDKLVAATAAAGACVVPLSNDRAACSTATERRDGDVGRAPGTGTGEAGAWEGKVSIAGSGAIGGGCGGSGAADSAGECA